MERFFNFVDEERASLWARLALGTMLLWFGAMNFTPVGENIVAGWLEGHRLMHTFHREAGLVAMVIGGIQLVLGLSLILTSGPFRKVASYGTATLCVIVLTHLIFADVWFAPMGGFPFLASGQGVIKYLAILGVALYVGAGHDEQAKERGVLTILFGLTLVLAWIGSFKFFEFEADGVEGLLLSSPFFSWLLDLFGKQGASNFIGIFELVTAAALFFGWFFQRTVFYVGATLAIITFIGTLSFLITGPGWQEDLGGFPALSRSGHFLLKDLVLLGGTFLLIGYREDH